MCAPADSAEAINPGDPPVILNPNDPGSGAGDPIDDPLLELDYDQGPPDLQVSFLFIQPELDCNVFAPVGANNACPKVIPELRAEQDCCYAHGYSGCSSSSCEAEVCGTLATDCCIWQWIESCAVYANTTCDICQPPGSRGTETGAGRETPQRVIPRCSLPLRPRVES